MTLNSLPHSFVLQGAGASSWADTIGSTLEETESAARLGQYR